jgi:hypothetical protein
MMLSGVDMQMREVQDRLDAMRQRAEAAELSLKLIEADNRDLVDAHRRIGELERELAAVRDGRAIDNDEGVELIIDLRRQLEAAEWQDAGFCPHCHADELRQSTDLYDDELNLSVIVYRCGACGALWAGDVNEWVRLVKRLEAAEADAATSDWYAKRAFAAEARVKELEEQLAGMLPAAQPLVTSIEFLPLAMANPLAEMTKRAEAAEAQLAIVSGLSEWHDLPELPTHVGHYLAFWAEDGAWIAQYWPSGIEDEKGNRGHWLTTPDGSIRPNPVAWRHLPSVPDRYVVQAEYFRA